MNATATEGSSPVGRRSRTPRFLSRPLESLAFLLPLILFYEIGSIALARSGEGIAGQDRVVAYFLLQFFFELFGSTGVWMPGLAVVVILLCTHAASGRPWRVRQRAVTLMYGESAALAAPLLLCSHLLSASPGAQWHEGSWLVDMVLGIGAGIYEELVFRWILISVLVMIGIDLLGWPRRIVLCTALVLSSLAFAAHHYPPLGSDTFAWASFLFRAGAGAYLGILFIRRGYGIVAGTHIAYNLLVTVVAS